MREAFRDAMVVRAADPRTVFLTGDLGFMALEPLAEALGPRFINAGIAEQNMVSVAAAMARAGLRPWAYSIAPFCYARPFEQIRNDAALHGLPVRLVGNGGGYGYGVMGPTHHAIEDYGVLLGLPGMAVSVPVFDQDVAQAIDWLDAQPGVGYLRLGRGEPPAGWAVPAWAPWRCLLDGDGPVLVAVGPLAGTYIAALQALPRAERPALWAATVLPVPLAPPPEALLAQLSRDGRLLVAEEHVAHGGFGSALLLWLAGRGQLPRRFDHLHAQAHVFDRYGSQAWLRQRSGLDAATLLRRLLD